MSLCPYVIFGVSCPSWLSLRFIHYIIDLHYCGEMISPSIELAESSGSAQLPDLLEFSNRHLGRKEYMKIQKKHPTIPQKNIRNNNKKSDNNKTFYKVPLATADWALWHISLVIGAPLIGATFVSTFYIEEIHLSNTAYLTQKGIKIHVLVFVFTLLNFFWRNSQSELEKKWTLIESIIYFKTLTVTMQKWHWVFSPIRC